MSYKRFRSIKPEIRVLGVDDGVFIPHSKGLVDVVGVVFRGGYWLDGVMRTEVEVDGLDGTEKIASMIIESPHYKQLRIIMLSGITLAGFNVVDIKELYNKTGLPVIAITRDMPNMKEIEQAIERLPEEEKRWRAIQNAGEMIKVRTREEEEPIYMQIAGIKREDAEKIVKITSTRSNIPEPLRVAHIIASGLTKFRKGKG